MLVGRGTHKKGEVGVSGRPQISWLSEGLAITQDFHTLGSLVTPIEGDLCASTYSNGSGMKYVCFRNGLNP